jgi:catechol 2,3-dioxygenase-like lactoylglutathione lyase family enzyme
MSTTAIPSSDATRNTSVGKVAMKLEVVSIPVSDVDRAKEFYGRLGWRLDADFTVGESHAVQFTPPGSPSSIHFGTHVTPAAPGSAQGLLLIVSDIQAAREELAARGAQVSEVYHYAGFNRVDPTQRLSGPAPERRSYGSWVSFSDPDGNGWLVQEITTRLPGRVAGATTYTSASDLADALRRASTAHGEHEKRNGGEYDENWPDWYAEYLVREQSGEAPPL